MHALVFQAMAHLSGPGIRLLRRSNTSPPSPVSGPIVSGFAWPICAGGGRGGFDSKTPGIIVTVSPQLARSKPTARADGEPCTRKSPPPRDRTPCRSDLDLEVRGHAVNSGIKAFCKNRTAAPRGVVPTSRITSRPSANSSAGSTVCKTRVAAAGFPATEPVFTARRQRFERQRPTSHSSASNVPNADLDRRIHGRQMLPQEAPASRARPDVVDRQRRSGKSASALEERTICPPLRLRAIDMNGMQEYALSPPYPNRALRRRYARQTRQLHDATLVEVLYAFGARHGDMPAVRENIGIFERLASSPGRAADALAPRTDRRG